MDESGSASGVAAWEAVLRVHATLVPRLAAAVEAATGLSLAWYDVLYELNLVAGRTLRMQDLGNRVVLSRTRVSRIVDGMAAAGMVEKTPDPDDGRATLAVMTPTGRRALRRAAPVYLRAIDEHFTSHLTDREVQEIRLGLARVVGAAQSSPTRGSAAKL